MSLSSARPTILADRAPDPNTVKVMVSAPAFLAAPSAIPAAYRSLLPTRSASIIARNPVCAMRAASFRQAISFSLLTFRKLTRISPLSTSSHPNALDKFFKSAADISFIPAMPSRSKSPFFRSSSAKSPKLVYTAMG